MFSCTAATTVLLFLVLWRMTADLWPSAFVAVVFAVHPLHVESVAWASQRKDVLSGLFWMLTLLAYGWYARCAGAGPLVAIAKFFTSAAATGRADLPSLIWYLLRTSVLYLLVVLLFVMGLMAKPVLVTLPFVLLLLDYWPLGRMDFRRVRACTHAGARPPLSTSRACKHAPYGLRWLVIEKLPLVLLAGAFCVATSLNEGEAVASLHGFPLSSRVANALVSYVAYVGQFLLARGTGGLLSPSGKQFAHREDRRRRPAVDGRFGSGAGMAAAVDLLAAALTNFCCQKA